VLALAGLEAKRSGGGSAGGSVHGRSLLPVMFGAREPDDVFAYGESMTPDLPFGWSALHAVRSPRFKFIDPPRPELYDLLADPGETTNIIGQQRQVAETMAKALDRLIEETSRNAPALEHANLDKETLERLASLGYVATSAVRNSAGERDQDLDRNRARWPIRRTSSMCSSRCSVLAS